MIKTQKNWIQLIKLNFQLIKIIIVIKKKDVSVENIF